MPAYELNPNPEIPCTCGPNLLCTHGALAPIDTREIQVRHLPHLAPTDPAGTNPAVPATKQVAEPTNTGGNPHV
jgi:hypothetical protein